jgi:hypothetical protein
MGTEPLLPPENLKLRTIFVTRQNPAFKQRPEAVNDIDDITRPVAEHTGAVYTLLLIESAYISAYVLSVK